MLKKCQVQSSQCVIQPGKLPVSQRGKVRTGQGRGLAEVARTELAGRQNQIPTKSQPQENLSLLVSYIFIAGLLPKWV